MKIETEWEVKIHRRSNIETTTGGINRARLMGLRMWSFKQKFFKQSTGFSFEGLLFFEKEKLMQQLSDEIENFGKQS